MFKTKLKFTPTAWDLPTNEIAPNYEAAFSLVVRVLTISNRVFSENNTTSKILEHVGD